MRFPFADLKEVYETAAQEYSLTAPKHEFTATAIFFAYDNRVISGCLPVINVDGPAYLGRF